MRRAERHRECRPRVGADCARRADGEIARIKAISAAIAASPRPRRRTLCPTPSRLNSGRAQLRRRCCRPAARLGGGGLSQEPDDHASMAGHCWTGEAQERKGDHAAPPAQGIRGGRQADVKLISQVLTCEGPFHLDGADGQDLHLSLATEGAVRGVLQISHDGRACIALSRAAASLLDAGSDLRQRSPRPWPRGGARRFRAWFTLLVTRHGDLSRLNRAEKRYDLMGPRGLLRADYVAAQQFDRRCDTLGLRRAHKLQRRAAVSAIGGRRQAAFSLIDRRDDRRSAHHRRSTLRLHRQRCLGLCFAAPRRPSTRPAPNIRGICLSIFAGRDRSTPS